MTISESNRFVKKAISPLVKEYGFSVKAGNVGLEMRREGTWAVDVVGFGFANFFGEVEAMGFSIYIGYPVVEKIASPILSKNDIIGEHDPKDAYYTFGVPNISKNSQHNLPKKIPIYCKEDLPPIIDKFRTYFSGHALPYFEKWKDLRTVSEFLNDIPQMEVHKYMSMGIFKKAVIWKLCNNPRYEEYMNWLYTAMRERYSKKPDGDINYKRDANAITELKEVLDKTEPIYP